MDAISYTTARANLASTMQKVCEDGTTVTINHENQPSVVLMSLAVYNAMQKTTHLLPTPANTVYLLADINALKTSQ